MRYHWIRDQVELKNVSVTWNPGADNLTECFTKAYPVQHHLQMMTTYLVVDDESVV